MRLDDAPRSLKRGDDAQRRLRVGRVERGAGREHLPRRGVALRRSPSAQREVAKRLRRRLARARPHRAIARGEHIGEVRRPAGRVRLAVHARARARERARHDDERRLLERNLRQSKRLALRDGVVGGVVSHAGRERAGEVRAARRARAERAEHRLSLAAHHAVVARGAVVERSHRVAKLVGGGAVVLLERLRQRLEAFRRAGGVEESTQLLVEESELILEVLAVVGVFDALPHRLHGDEVLGPGVAVNLILQRVLDLLLEFLRNVAAVRDVADASHRHGTRELPAERR